MLVDFAFGKIGLPVELPSGYDYRLLEARSARPVPNENEAIAAALDSPVGTRPLKDLAVGKNTAAISVCDITRPVPNRLILPHVLDRLETTGISRDNITILIATGLHRPATDAEIAEIIGPDLFGKIRVLNHHAKNLAEHSHLGQTSSGTPVYIDRRFIEADLHITLGFIEPHLRCGIEKSANRITPPLSQSRRQQRP